MSTMGDCAIQMLPSKGCCGSKNLVLSLIDDIIARTSVLCKRKSIEDVNICACFVWRV